MTERPLSVVGVPSSVYLSAEAVRRDFELDGLDGQLELRPVVAVRRYL